jgi:predicted dehydrogenase
VNRPRGRSLQRLNVGVVGYGVMGRHHANNYAALPHARLVAISDIDPQRMREAAAEQEVAVYADLDAFIAHPGLDAVSVAAPTSVHFDITRRLLEAGVHVLVEKPVATEVAEAQELAAISRRMDRVLQVGHITRFYRAVQELPQRVTAPYLIEARRLSTATRNRDVGAILDLMIHDIDIVLSLVESPVRDCTVAAHRVNGSAIEDVAAAQMVFENGCIARLLASRLAPDAERTLIVAEPEQTLRLDFDKFPNTELAIYRPLPAAANGEHHQVEHILVRDENPLRAELEHFLARVRGDAAPIGTLEDDVRALAVANRLRAQLTAPARENGRKVPGIAAVNGGAADAPRQRNGAARESPRPVPRA